ncbi:MAG: hypothetical protein IPM15_22825 [Betaproteobacteria bacterium]|nr:hypothetical protein [Betaproteobacteria bacterium]
MPTLRTLAAVAATAAIALFASPEAFAQGAASAERPWRGFVGIGLAGGGDKLATVQWSNGDTTNINAGGLVDLRGGVDVRLGDTPFTVQASLGWFVHRASGTNGSVTFERFPLEVLGTWRATDTLRLAAGLRRAGNGKLEGRGAASNLGRTTFKAKLGAVVEGEWLFGATRSYGLALRAVSEEYDAPNGTKADGSHVGLRLSWYF